MYRILLADDEALIREGVSENVPWEKCGYLLAGSFENGKQVLDFVRKESVDVVITDICMPFMDGIELAEILSEESPETKIIILSGYDDFEYAKKAIRFNVYEYLLKPITSSELCDVLERLKRDMDEEKERQIKIRRMQTNYHRGQILLHSDALLNLITGSKTEEESRKELSEVGIDLSADLYQVAIAELDIYAKTERPDEKMKKESALMSFVVWNISQEIVAKNHLGEVCQGKDLRTFFLFGGNDTENFSEKVREVCQEIIEKTNLMMNMEVNIGLGGSVSGLNHIYLSYEAAEAALEYHYSMGGSCILEMERIAAAGQAGDRQQQVDQLVETMIFHLKESNQTKLKEDAVELSDMFVNFVFDRGSIGRIMQRIVQAVDEIYRSAEPEQVPDDIEPGRVLDGILEAGEMKRAIAMLVEYLVRICILLDNRKNIGGKRYALTAMDYMEKNYGDSELSLQTVCSYLNISMSRFSSIFKASMGQTFVDALSAIRMQKAKELLENTDLKNYEIAERVGFNDPHYFSIAFKKMTGMSPTEYAKDRKK